MKIFLFVILLITCIPFFIDAFGGDIARSPFGNKREPFLSFVMGMIALGCAILALLKL